MKSVIQQIVTGSIGVEKTMNKTVERKPYIKQDSSLEYFTGKIVNLILPYIDSDISDNTFNKLHDRIREVVVEIKHSR